MTRTRVLSGAYCPSQELRFAIVSRDDQYLVSIEVPFQWDEALERASLWDRRLDAETFLKVRLSVSRYRYRVVEVREETR